uniref:NADH-ubiquinone oxidoreductase chain 3 n=1 Tax=Livia junci TaxID=1449964 RepID=A0A344A2I9_9HEMI|nr:NADH dehydrogenase subunit 3 [Livia junci]AWU48980.1 NADH dehydrogenase subunit 3 [Livia junci]
MLLIFMLLMLMWILLILIILGIPIINLHKSHDREKLSPFECGFDPFSKSRISFSIHFFVISLMFLIFDIEITLIFPLPLIFMYTNVMSWTLISALLIMVLSWGLFIEWKEGSMNWK